MSFNIQSPNLKGQQMSQLAKSHF